MSRLPILLIDLLLVAALLISCVIAVTGGGDVRIGSTMVHARSVGNPLIAAYALGAARYLFGRRLPLFGIATLQLSDLDTKARRTVGHVVARLSSFPTNTAWRLVAAFSVVVLAIKLANAWVYFGFFSGDDVEIHEMTLGALLHRDWPVWNLRSSFYPMVFVYPAQWLAATVGFTATRTLVFAGRAVVAVISTTTIPLLFAVGRRHGTQIGLMAAFFVGWNHLCVSFGSTELPRPVSTVFVLLAFASIARGTTKAMILAGVGIGVAAAMRFSEAVFILPATIHLVIERRWKHASLVVIVGTITAAGIQAVSDQLYWGSLFFSVRNAIDFTLVHRDSTRGFQSFWYYLTHATAWTDFFVLGCAVYATAFHSRRVALWAWTPVLVLSLLPHKEPRYLLPVAPFVALLAAIGLWRMAVRFATSIEVPATWLEERMPFLLLAGLLGSVLFEAGGFHFRRSEDAVRTANAIASSAPSGVGLEQAWRFGGHLYLPPHTQITDLSGEEFRDPDRIKTIARSPDLQVAVVSRPDCAQACTDALHDAGFEQDSRPDVPATYTVFRRPVPLK